MYEASLKELREKVEKAPSSCGYAELSMLYLQDHLKAKETNRGYSLDCLFEAMRLAQESEKYAESFEDDNIILDTYSKINGALKDERSIASSNKREVFEKMQKFYSKSRKRLIIRLMNIGRSMRDDSQINGRISLDGLVKDITEN